MAVPPSLRVRVGVPPETVTASFKFTVRVTTLPTPRSPEPAVMPVPEATTDDTEGVVVSICDVRQGWPAGWSCCSALPARSVIVPLTPVTASSAVF